MKKTDQQEVLALSKSDKIMHRVSEHLEHYRSHFDNEWIGIFLQGSQNYGLDYEESNVDTKIIVLPKFKDIVFGKPPVSTTSVLPNDEHLDIKDIRLMFECFRKQNINFLEILYTEYFILNPKYEALFRPIIDGRDKISHYNNYASVSCMVGMVHEKRKQLMRPAHPNVEKFGYDGKQLHHMERVLEFFYRYTQNVPYAECLVSRQRDYLLSLKKHEISIEEAVRRGDLVVSMIDEAADKYRREVPLAVNADVDSLFKNALTSIMRTFLLHECSVCNESEINAEYVSVWDNGAVKIRSACKVNTVSHEVFDIELVDTSDTDVSFCDAEYVIFNGRRHAVQETQNGYFYEEEEIDD